MTSRPSALVAWGLLALFGLSACTTNPEVSVDRTDSMPDYARNIYLYQPAQEDDPRGVFPRVQAGLMDLGFDVTPVAGRSPILGRQGTAFVVSEDGYFLSTAHIFRRQHEATLWLDGERYEADIVKSDRGADLALLKLKEASDQPLHPLPFAAEKSYRMGAEVFSIGYPLSDILGREPRLNSGLISAAVGMRDDPNFLQVSIETQPGNSGSPVFNENREVVGMMKGTLHPATLNRVTGGRLPQNVNFAMKQGFIEAFLEGTGVELRRGAGPETDFETLSRSVAQVRSGIIDDEIIEANKLGCRITYHSVWELWYRFSYFQLVFFDIDTGRVILVVGNTRDQLGNAEDVVIEQTLQKTYRKLQREG